MKKIMFAYIIINFLIIGSCTEQNDPDIQIIPEQEINDILTPEQDSALAAADDTIFDPGNIALPFGDNVKDFMLQYNSTFNSKGNKSAQLSFIDEMSQLDQAKLLISRLALYDNDLVRPMLHVYPYEGVNKPAQNGLAYVWGSRNINQRYIHRDKNGNLLGIQCEEERYGLDCSGMIISAFRDAGVILSTNLWAVSLANPKIYNDALKKSNDFKKLEYVETGISYTYDSIQTGDIIYLGKGGYATHIGIALTSNNVKKEVFIFQSNGTIYKTGSIVNGKLITDGCESNNALGKRGPRLVSAKDFESWGFDFYGILTLKIKDVSPPTALIPTLTTAAIKSLTATTASSGGIIISDGGAPITAKGVCWSTSPNPTLVNVVNNNITSDGTGTLIYTSTLTGLSPGKDYHVRAYATNSSGTAYGNDIPFKTLAVTPTVTTTPVTVFTQTTATVDGNVTDDGGADVTEKGVWYGTTEDYTTSGLRVPATSMGIGAINCSLADLTAGQLYYVRAYATNSSGTTYGNQVTFVTSPRFPATYIGRYEYDNYPPDAIVNGYIELELSVDNGVVSGTAKSYFMGYIPGPVTGTLSGPNMVLNIDLDSGDGDPGPMVFQYKQHWVVTGTFKEGNHFSGRFELTQTFIYNETTVQTYTGNFTF